jgi:hypothetical protein
VATVILVELSSLGRRGRCPCCGSTGSGDADSRAVVGTADADGRAGGTDGLPSGGRLREAGDVDGDDEIVMTVGARRAVTSTSAVGVGAARGAVSELMAAPLVESRDMLPATEDNSSIALPVIRSKFETDSANVTENVPSAPSCEAA